LVTPDRNAWTPETTRPGAGHGDADYEDDEDGLDDDELGYEGLADDELDDNELDHGDPEDDDGLDDELGYDELDSDGLVDDELEGEDSVAEAADDSESRLPSRFGADAAFPGRMGRARRPAKNPESPASGGNLRRTVALVVVVIAAVAGVTYWTMTGGSPHTTTTAPPAVLPTVAPVPADFLNSASTDRDPVTENEFFRDSSIVAGLHTYTRLTRKLDQGCPDLTGAMTTALAGQAPVPAPAASTGPASTGPASTGPATTGPATVATTAATPGPLCRQLVRALYLGEPDKSGRRLIAGIAVLVLDSAATAKNTAQFLNAGFGGVAPLPLPAGGLLPAAKVSGPNGDNAWRTAFPDGHYAILMQLAYSDGTKGKSTDPVLSDGADDLKKVTAAPLDDRAVLGRGYRG
jgi:hypothetical protein